MLLGLGGLAGHGKGDQQHRRRGALADLKPSAFRSIGVDAAATRTPLALYRYAHRGNEDFALTRSSHDTGVRNQSKHGRTRATSYRLGSRSRSWCRSLLANHGRSVSNARGKRANARDRSVRTTILGASTTAVVQPQRVGNRCPERQLPPPFRYLPYLRHGRVSLTPPCFSISLFQWCASRLATGQPQAVALWWPDPDQRIPAVGPIGPPNQVPVSKFDGSFRRILPPSGRRRAGAGLR